MVAVLCADLLRGDDGAVLLDAHLPDQCFRLPLGWLQVAAVLVALRFYPASLPTLPFICL